MDSADSGVDSPAYTHSISLINDNTDHIEPKQLRSDTECNTAKYTNDNDHNDEFSSGCTAYTRFLSDWRSILLLLFLYTLQGLPIGLRISIPLIIQEKSVSYNQQAKFSLAQWPFSLKLLWAPLVDALYVKRMGRRKSWLIPVQYLIGLTLFILSYQVDHLIDTEQIGMLTVYFFILNFLTATQDVAVDGWALTMLKRENVGLQSACNLIGQAFGTFIGHAVFLNLASKDFCNSYVRSVPQENGLVTLSSFMVIWSCIYFITTTLILILKHEGDENHADDENTIFQSYIRLYEITKLPAVWMCILLYMTRNIGLAAVSGVSDLKLVEAGLEKETKALLSVPMTPISLLLPVFLSKWTASYKPMVLYMKAYAVGLVLSGIIGGMVWVTGAVKDTITVGGGFPGWYIPLLLLVQCCYKMCTTTMVLSYMAFNAKISDPAYGATFVTLYNTIGNLGIMWPIVIALRLVDPLTIKTTCIDDSATVCDKSTTKVFDGYYIETIGCVVLGFVWFFWGQRVINKLQKKPESEWRIVEKSNDESHQKNL